VNIHLSTELEQRLQQALHGIERDRIVERIWQHDHTVWHPEPAEISDRLGWLHCPENMAAALPDIMDFVHDLQAAGFTHVLLLGMGGSSLAPEVFRLTFGVKDGYLDLAVLDSTHPEVVLAFAEKLDPAKTLFLVSTKSGGTVETLSFLKYFYNRTADALGTANAGDHFAAITDPGSGLETLAQNLGFRKIFLNDANIGGRFSALSFFGLVPAGLLGIDLQRLLNRAQNIAHESTNPDRETNQSATLGCVMAELARAGKDKLTLVASEQIQSFGAWAEQLIAESTGKAGTGILPVDLEPLDTPASYGNDRFFVALTLQGDNAHAAKLTALREAGFPVVEIALTDLYDLGTELFRWQFATAIAGHRMGIQPFDQPDVESAKVQARKMVSAYHESGALPALSPTDEENGIEIFADSDATSVEEALQQLLKTPHAEDVPRPYVAIQAFIQPTAATDRALQALRQRIRETHKVAVTVGYGPRFLHSTGQLHKGDAGNGLFIQLTATPQHDAAIPDEPAAPASKMTFGVLIAAQAMGDRQALINRGRHVVRFHFTGDVVDGIDYLTKMIDADKN